MFLLDSVKNYLDSHQCLSSDFKEYNKMYLFTTENIKEYLSHISLKDKEILSVCGSGDQLLNAYLLGAKNVTCFDINYLAKAMLMFKISAVRNLSFDQFKRFFIKEINKAFLNKEDYKKIRCGLDSELKEFFDYIFQFTPQEIYYNYFYDFDITNKKMNKINLYFNQYYYDELKKIIKNKEPEVIHCNLSELPSKLEFMYDIILLSNISDTIEFIYDKEVMRHYRDLINELLKFVPVGGIIQAGYIYEFKREKKYNLFEFDDLRNGYFVSDDKKEIEELVVNGYGYLDSRKKDKVLFVRKLK